MDAVAKVEPSARRSGGLVRRLLRAQESGLVLVIAVMMACLAFFGGSIERMVQVRLPAGVAWEQGPGGELVLIAEDAALIGRVGAALKRDGAGNVVVRAGGREARFRGGQAPSVRALTEDDVRLFARRTVNKFFNLEYLMQVAKDASFIAIMAVGMTAVIVMGGIDLSVGSIYALAAVFGAQALVAVMGESGGAPWYVAVPVGFGVCMLVGGIAGLANGAMIVGLRVHPFIITLGTMAAFRGIVFVQSKGQSIGPFPDSFTTGFVKAKVLGVYPVPVIVMLLVAAAGMIVLHRTVLGRRAYAVGGNETAAKYAGVPVGRVKIVFYALCGALAGLSAAVYLGYLGGFEGGAGRGYELQVIAAAVIGGASLSGGRGSALGAVLGSILIQLIDSGMIILGIDQNYRDIVLGAAIVVAVVLDQLKGSMGSGARR